MASYNSTSSYNRTYEKKVIEEAPRVRITTQTHTPFIGGIGLPMQELKIQGLSPFIPTSGLQFHGSGQVSSFHATDDSFFASLDVSAYDDDLMKVSVVGQQIVVEAHQSEKSDEMGTIERTFTRKFALPKNVQPESVTSQLTTDGILTIKALPPNKETTPARQIQIKIVNNNPQEASNESAKTTEGEQK
ncbi:unnamed protein product [Caenorhabditis auriculariae]|uniref:SHSP domain-containing protein n=1 Tax=Caenorhabditis auriculariae TaxID=2777116 RepID=A0A8S1HDA2_9PELO|nr:unnamed protein product [Caenorhabditis auriculariae]